MGSSTSEVSKENTPNQRLRLLWVDRPPIEHPNYGKVVVFPDDYVDDDELVIDSKLFNMSENTERLLREAFTKGVSNPARKQWRERYGDPRCVQTNIPKMDKMVKDCLRAKMDRSLALDAIDPLASIVKKGEKGTLTVDAAITAARQALKFLENTAVQFSRERDGKEPSMT